jgi:hypothetical protein
MSGKLAPAAGALITAILCSLPNLLGLWDLGRDYTPFSVGPSVSSVVWDESHVYSANPGKFMRTGSLDPELDLYELRSFPSAYPIFHTIVLGSLGRALGSLEAAWILAHALFPALYFLLLYHIAGLATPNQPLRLAIAWASILIPYGPRNFLLVGQFASIQPLEYTKTPHPDLNFPLLILGCYLTIRAIEKNTWGQILLAGLCVGLNFYTYYFYTVAMAGALGIVLALTLLRNKLPWKTLILICGVGALVALPAVYRAYDGIRAGVQKNLTDRMGVHTHAPIIPGLILLVACLLGALYTFGKLHSKNFGGRRQQFLLCCLFFLAVVGACGAGLNLQVLTGFDPQHDHFWSRVIDPVGFLLLALVAAYVASLRLAGRWLTVTGVAGVIVLLGLAGFRQSRITNFTEQDHRRSAPGMAVLEWAASHTPPDTVLGTLNLEMILLEPTVANRWTFLPLAIRSMASSEEILKRYLILCALQGMSVEEAEQNIREEQATGAEPWRNIDAVFHVPLDRIRPQVRLMWPSVNLQEDLKTRKLDYVVVPVTANLCTTAAASRLCPEEAVYANAIWKVIRVRAEAGR